MNRMREISFNTANRCSTPAVSVITPIYNRIGFLHAIISTLQQQTLSDLELILVDDGSEHDVSAAIETIKTDVFIRLIRLEQNKGGASARNVGLEYARGRYVAFLDSDDRWFPDKLRMQFEQLEAAADRANWVSLTRQLVSGERNYVTPRKLLTGKTTVGEYLFRSGGVIQTSMMFMIAELAKAVRFVEGGRGHDDWSFALRLEQAGARFEMLPEALTIYNDNSDHMRRSPPYSAARLEWLEQWRSNLGELPYLAARAAFSSKIPSGLLAGRLETIARALIVGAIPPWRAGYYAARLAVPSLGSLGAAARQEWLKIGGAWGDSSKSPPRPGARVPGAGDVN